MATIKQIRLSGLGGHGVVFAGTLLGKAAISEGKHVSGANAYGSQARGGLTRADIVISDQPILFPHILEIDVLVAFAQSAFESNQTSVKPGSGIVFYDKSQFLPGANESFRQIGLEITSQVLNELDNKQVINIAFLGAMNAHLGLVETKSLEDTIRTELPTQLVEINLKALDLGKRLGEIVQ